MAGPQGFWAAGRLGCCGEAGIRQGNRNGWAATVKNGAATVKRTARPAKSLRLRQTGSMASAPRLVTNRNKTSCRIKIGKALELEAAGCLQSPVQSLAGPTLQPVVFLIQCYPCGLSKHAVLNLNPNWQTVQVYETAASSLCVNREAV